MHLNSTSLNLNRLNSFKQKQQGFLLPLALFIVVVMGLFALVLSRNTIQTGTAAVQEITSTQAFYAAESGAQLGMQNLFFPDASFRQQADQRCVNLISVPITRTYASGTANDVPGLNGCTVRVTCDCLYQNNSVCDPTTNTNYANTGSTPLSSFYHITSAATCGVGNLRSTRTIEVGSFLRQE